MTISRNAKKNDTGMAKEQLRQIGILWRQTMNLRTIMIFPDFYNMEVFDNIREKYDPLAKLYLLER